MSEQGMKAAAMKECAPGSQTEKVPPQTAVKLASMICNEESPYILLEAFSTILEISLCNRHDVH